MGHLRIASTDDAGAIAAIYAPYVRDTVISFEQTPPSASEMAARIASTLERLPYLVFDQGEGPIGYAYAGAHAERAAYRWSVNVSAYVAPQAHRMGVGRALYTELLGLLERQRFHTAFAGITLPNDKSIGLHEAMGFAHLGTYREVGFKHGAWRDVGYWRRSIADGPPTGEPIPFPSL